MGFTIVHLLIIILIIGFGIAILLPTRCASSERANRVKCASNLRQIARDLNIGLDSLVFVDDSEFEANLVRTLVPEVEVILLPTNRSVEYRSLLASCGLFDGLTVSREDRARGFIETKDRWGVQRRFPLLTVSIAAVNIGVGTCFSDVATAAAAGKKIAKAATGSAYVRDGVVLRGGRPDPTIG